MKRAGNGLVAAAAAFALWGIFPLYFHLLLRVSAVQVIAHRVVWSCVFVLAWIVVRGELAALRATLADRRIIRRLAVTALLVSLNWLVYVWAVMNDRVVEASLGYFIGPLVNVLLGVVLLSEKLSRLQWSAVALAGGGVSYLAVMAGGPPWIALILALSFACYGLVRKVVKVESLPGLAIETLVLFPFAAAYLLWCGSVGRGAMGHDAVLTALLVGTGPLTAIALFLYAYGARRLPYSSVGVLQYIMPTLQFACGVFALHEGFDRTRAIGFAAIWLALLIYAGDSWRLSRRPQRRQGAPAR